MRCVTYDRSRWVESLLSAQQQQQQQRVLPARSAADLAKLGQPASQAPGCGEKCLAPLAARGLRAGETSDHSSGSRVDTLPDDLFFRHDEPDLRRTVSMWIRGCQRQMNRLKVKEKKKKREDRGREKKTERQKRAWGRAELRRSAARVEARAPVCLLVCLFVFNSRDACLFFVITACKSRSYGSCFFLDRAQLVVSP